MSHLLNIRILTYNHERYISKCLESILAQKANFGFKVIIGEDCSTDNTALICAEFKKNYPTLIELYCNSYNNLQLNSSNSWGHCINNGAKYIALCEGDDYWTDPLKLQKQVDFLEGNPDYSAVFGSTEVLQVNPDRPSMAFSNFGGTKDFDLVLEDVLKEKMPVHISSILFRREVLSPAFLELKKGVVPGDRYLAAGCFLKGKIRYLAQPFSVYRRHASGISQTSDHYGIGLHAGNVHMLFRLLKLFPQNNQGVLASYLTWRLNETAYEYRRISGFSVKRKALKLIYRFYPFHLFLKFFLRETLIQLFPRLIQRIHAPSQPA